MNKEEEDQLNIQDLFKRDPKLPFHYNVQFSEINAESTVADCFNILKNILVQGLTIVSDGELLQIDPSNNTQTIDIGAMTDKHFKKVKDRFLSLGIEPNWKVYDNSYKDLYF